MEEGIPALGIRTSSALFSAVGIDEIDVRWHLFVVVAAGLDDEAVARVGLHSHNDDQTIVVRRHLPAVDAGQFVDKRHLAANVLTRDVRMDRHAPRPRRRSR